MDPRTWERLEAVFFEALERPTTERSAFLDLACAGDPELRAEVEAVLAVHLAIDQDGDAASPAALTGARLGPYVVEERVGRGGMGEVYRAHRADDSFDRVVAVKVIRSGIAARELVQRFTLERRILARLDHPNIAPLLDGGVTPAGEPYLVMPFVEGQPIDEHVDARALPIPDRLRLFVTACRAVQFAHANLVVHRDLKPSNILVTGSGDVRLLDFGIAKLLDPAESTVQVATESLLLLTPEHAAPEQFLGLPITTSTDVYQLGVLLYQLLTGEKPFRAETTLDLHRAICEHEPTRPSAALTRGGPGDDRSDTALQADRARARASTPKSLRRRLRGDLDRIVLKALRKEPDRRYGSVAALADDVERHLLGLPVHARPAGFAYVASRFVRRNRAAVAAGVALLVSLVALAATSLRFAATSAAQAEAIAAERDVAIEVSAFLEGLFEASDPFATLEQRDTLRLRDFLDQSAGRVRVGLVGQPVVQARLLTTLAKAYRNLGRFEEARPLVEEAVTLRAANGGSDDPELAATRVELARVLTAMSEYDAAEVVLATALSVLARDSVTQAAAFSGGLAAMGRVYQDRGAYHDAEATYRRASVVAELDPALEDGGRAQHLASLATVLMAQARFEEAETLLASAVTLSRSHFGETHPTTADMQHNYGRALMQLGRFGEAEPVLRGALAIRRERLAPPHPAIAESVNILAQLLLATGDAEEAEALFHESLSLRRAAVGDEHPGVAVGLMNVAAVLQRDVERRPEAMRLYEEARGIVLASLGPEHPLIADIEGNLSFLFHESGDHERAIRHAQSALPIRQGALGDAHPLVLGTLSDIGRCLTELERYSDAESYLLRAFTGLEPQREERAQRWVSVLGRLETLYSKQGREEEARHYGALRATPPS